MENHPRPVLPDRRTTRTKQQPSIPTTRQQRTAGLLIGPFDITSSRVLGVVIGAVEAVAAEEQIVRAIDKDQIWRFDEDTVRGVAVEDLGGWGASGCDAVGFDGLEHQGRGMGFVAVAAGAAAAEVVFVDFVDDVAGAVGVGEAGCVDGAAEAVGGGISWWRLGEGREGEGRKK